MALRKHIKSFSLFSLPILLILVLWELLSRLRILNPTLFSSPSQILSTLFELTLATGKTFTSHSLLIDIGVSLYRLGFSFLIALLIGLPLAILMGRSSLIYNLVDPIITLLVPIPGIAWTPIFIIWLGFGDPTIITVGAFASFFPIVQNVTMGIRSIDKRYLWCAEIMGARKRDFWLKILIPWSFPFLLTGVKLAIARGWRTIIAVEMIAASLSGLGFLIFDARDYLQPSVIYGGIIVLSFVYIALESLIRLVEKRTIEKWGIVLKGGL